VDPVRTSKKALESLYREYNKRKYVHPDPIEFLYRYRNVRDREIAGLVASALAYGRVNQILKSIEIVLSRMGASPQRYLAESSVSSIAAAFPGFKHRFTKDVGLVSLLLGARNAILTHGSLNRCFVAGLREDDPTVAPAIERFAEALNCEDRFLLPRPSHGSACKRLNLYLRWMVRRDDVDPGGWQGVSSAKLIVPIDIHMKRIAGRLGLTRRKTPNMAMALEVTAAFRRIAPDDPVRYDFALTRFGIRPELEISGLLQRLRTT
jgi:uncharacterized protein (TIGR02757 family)